MAKIKEEKAVQKKGEQRRLMIIHVQNVVQKWLKEKIDHKGTIFWAAQNSQAVEVPEVYESLLIGSSCFSSGASIFLVESAIPISSIFLTDGIKRLSHDLTPSL